MNNFIKFFYNMKVTNTNFINNYYEFNHNNNYYRLYILNEEYNIYNYNNIYTINKELINNTLMSEIILNKDKNIITTYHNINYILLKINCNINKNITLEEIDYLSKVKIDITGLTTTKLSITPTKDWNLMLNLSDLHIGAKVESHSLYENTWTEKDIHNSLENVLNQVRNLGTFNTIFLNLLGDMLDGMDNQTARRDHIMPQGMDNYEQFDVFFKELTWFINELNKLSKELVIHSVPNGNHTGAPEYIAMKALQAVVNNIEGVTMIVNDKFIGYYSVNNHVFLYMHGKDDRFMKKPLPLHLTGDAVNWLNNFMDREGITNDYDPGHIHVIKGDLHQASFDSTYKFDYRNCLSLFGDSDYSQMNYTSNLRGCSYSLLIGNQIINGEFVVC